MDRQQQGAETTRREGEREGGLLLGSCGALVLAILTSPGVHLAVLGEPCRTGAELGSGTWWAAVLYLCPQTLNLHFHQEWKRGLATVLPFQAWPQSVSGIPVRRVRS